MVMVMFMKEHDVTDSFVHENIKLRKIYKTWHLFMLKDQ